MKRKFLVEMQFVGRKFFGFQSLDGRRTVQGAVEEAIGKVFGENVRINGCSRTDAGVSAERYFFDFAVDTKLPVARLPYKLNAVLPKDVQIISAAEKPLGFDARKDAKGKIYEYSFYFSDHLLPLVNPSAYRLPADIDAENAEKTAEVFIGKHDFRAFITADDDGSPTEREIFAAKFFADGNRGKAVFYGRSFAYNQVRIMAGAIADAAMKKTDPDKVGLLLESKVPRGMNPALTLPPKGLVLKDVVY